MLELIDERPVIVHAQQLRQLHELFLQGQDQNLEADSLRDEMEGTWYAMTPVEQSRVSELSGDFYALSDGNARAVPMNPTQRREWELEFRQAFDARDYDRALLLLRQPPSDLPLSTIHLRQSECWDGLGDPDTARVFRDAAERLARGSDNGVSDLSVQGISTH